MVTEMNFMIDFNYQLCFNLDYLYISNTLHLSMTEYWSTEHGLNLVCTILSMYETRKFTDYKECQIFFLNI